MASSCSILSLCSPYNVILFMMTIGWIVMHHNTYRTISGPFVRIPQRLQVLETVRMVLLSSSFILEISYYFFIVLDFEWRIDWMGIGTMNSVAVRSLLTMTFVPLAVLTLVWSWIMRKELEKAGLLEDLPPDAPDPNSHVAVPLILFIALLQRRMLIMASSCSVWSACGPYNGALFGIVVLLIIWRVTGYVYVGPPRTKVPPRVRYLHDLLMVYWYACLVLGLFVYPAVDEMVPVSTSALFRSFLTIVFLVLTVVALLWSVFLRKALESAGVHISRHDGDLPPNREWSTVTMLIVTIFMMAFIIILGKKADHP